MSSAWFLRNPANKEKTNYLENVDDNVTSLGDNKYFNKMMNCFCQVLINYYTIIGTITTVIRKKIHSTASERTLT